MGNLRTQPHPLGLTASQLHHVRQLVGLAELALHGKIAGGEGIAGDHLRNDHARAKTLGQLPQRAIGDPRHGRKESIVAQLMLPDAQLVGTVSHKLPQKWSF